MRQFLSAVHILFEDARPVVTEAAPLETPAEAHSVYNWGELKSLVDASSHGQVKGVFDMSTNSAVVGDAASWSHRELRESVGSGVAFTIQRNFGGAEKMTLDEGFTMSTDVDPDDLSPAFARLFGLSAAEYERRWAEYVARL